MFKFKVTDEALRLALAAISNSGEVNICIRRDGEDLFVPYGEYKGVVITEMDPIRLEVGDTLALDGVRATLGFEE